MVCDSGSAQKLVVPVVVCSKGPIMEVGVIITTAVFVDGLCEVGLIGVEVTFEKHSCIFVCITEFEDIGCFLDTYITVISDLCFLVTRTFFGGDENYTVCSAYTIDSGSRSIFQDRHFLNIRVVQEVDVVVEHTIYNEQRLTVGE